ncbi:hypothetical protein [Oerskovia jenensis]|uniref:hypothetical protein n=1 Tax=Oerskovia jenensis TaxID=162169 RepID=UPI0036D99475
MLASPAVAETWTIRALARKGGVTQKKLRAWVREQGWERTSNRWLLDDEQATAAVAHFEALTRRQAPRAPTECSAADCERTARGEHGLCKMHYQRRARTGRTERSSGGDWQAAKTHCPNGHQYTPENTYTFPSDGAGRRRCRACRVAQSTAWKQQRRATA